MTETEAKIAALKFAQEMCIASRLSTIEECALIADNHARNARWRYKTPLAEAFEMLAADIRSLLPTDTEKPE